MEITMKNKIISSVLVMLFVLVMLASCKLLNRDNGQISGGDGSSAEGGVIFAPGGKIDVVKSKDDKELNVEEIWNKLNGFLGDGVSIKDDGKAKDKNEIVVGDTSRPISKKAMSALESGLVRLKRDWEDRGIDTRYLVGYAVYSDGESVAIVWNDENLERYAVEYFAKNYLNGSTLELENGYVSVQGLDLIEIFRENENARRETVYSEITAEYGEDVSDALRNYLGMIDERFYIWLADLYDPGEYDAEGNPLGGGFYYSNSGRNTPGYGIDLESTMQAMSWLISAGLATSQTQLRETLPESMFREMAAFALSCQSSVDGYFYHPQWGTNISTSRLGRDLSWATEILALCGVQPYWDTPNSVAGKYGAPLGYEVDPEEYSASISPAALTGSLGMSSVTAVSRVKAVSGEAGTKWLGSSQLATVAAWEEYILSFKDSIAVDSYSIANTFNAQKSQIKARDEMAIANKELRDLDDDGIADGGYIEIFERYFNEWQNPENGLWEECSVSDRTVYYSAVNGLMKCAQIYNELKIPLNYADKAFECAVFMASYIGENDDGSDWADSKGQAPYAAVDVFNPWVAMQELLENVRRHGSKDESNALRATVKANALEMVQVTTRKVAKFKKDDGSYGYSWGAVVYKSQGVPVAVEGTVEGDVNGATLSFIGAFNYMRNVLEFDEALKPFGYSDLLVFADRIESLQHVMKDEAVIDTDAGKLDFDDDAVGVAPQNATSSLLNGFVEVVQDETDGDNRYLKFTAISGTSGNSFAFTPATTKLPTGIAFEMRLKFDTITEDNDTVYQIRLDEAYMLTIGAYTDGTFVIGDSSSRDSGPITNRFNGKFSAYDWNKIRIEYYVVGVDKGEAIIQIYVNEELRFVSVNYYGSEKELAPSLDFGTARVFALKDTDVVCYFDDLYAGQINNQYVEKPIVNPNMVKDFESSEQGGLLPEGVSGSGDIISDGALGNALSLSGEGNSVAVEASVTAVRPNCAAVTAKMMIPTSASGLVAKLYLAGASADKALMAYELSVYAEGDTTYASLSEFNKAGEYGKTYAGLPVGEWFTLTLEFYPYFYESDACAVAYLNGKEIGRGNGYYYIGTVSLAIKSFIVTTVSDMEILLDDVAPEWGRKVFTSTDGDAVSDPDVVLPQGGKSSSTAAGVLHDGVFSFDGAALGTPKVSGLSTSVNVDEYGNYIDIVTDPTDAANQVLMHKVIPSTVKGNSTSYTASKLSPSEANCHVLEFNLYVMDGDPQGMQISMNGVAQNSQGKNVDVKLFQTNTYVTGVDGEGTLTIQTKRDHTASLSHISDASAAPDKSENFGEIVPTVDVFGWVNIRYELYTDQGVVKIYYDGRYRSETDVVYTNQMDAAFTAVNIFNIKGMSAEFYFDNVVVESIVKEYESEICEDVYAPAGADAVEEPDEGGDGTVTPDVPTLPEDFDGTYRFDDCQSGTFDVVGVEGSYTGGYAMVMEDPRNSIGKVLQFYTVRGGTDSLTLAVAQTEDYAKFVFEWEMSLGSIGAAGTLMQIALGTGYLMEIRATDTDTYALYDVTCSDTSRVWCKSTAVKEGMSVGEWYKIRVEYAEISGAAQIKTFVGGTLLAVTDNYRNESGTDNTLYREFVDVSFISAEDAKFAMDVDNVVAELSADAFDVESYTKRYHITDTPTIIPDAAHDFEDGNITLSIDKVDPIADYSVVDDPLATSSEEAVNKVLLIAVNSAAQTQDENTLNIHDSSASTNPGTYEFSIDVCWKLGAVSKDTILAQYVIKTASGTLEIISLKYKTNGKMLITADSDVEQARATLANNADIANGKWHNLRFVVHQAGADTVLDLYIDGELTASANCYQNAAITEKDGCVDKVLIRARKCSNTVDGVASDSYNYYIDNAYLICIPE